MKLPWNDRVYKKIIIDILFLFIMIKIILPDTMIT